MQRFTKQVNTGPRWWSALLMLCSVAAMAQLPSGAPQGSGVIGGVPPAKPAAVEPAPPVASRKNLWAFPGTLDAPPMVAAMAHEETEEPAKPGHESMKVHGHWVVDIRNPDGTLAEHRAFENSVQYDGQNYLVGLLSGYASAGGYEIYFSNAAANATNAVCPSGTYPYCTIVQSTTAAPGAFGCTVYTCFSGLTVTPNFGAGPTLVLQGSMTAPKSGSIGAIGTAFNGCNSSATSGFPLTVSTVAPATCQTSTAGVLGGTMTYTNPTPISVTAGQLIQITVTISFS
ncbi:hypothetical protein SAMN05421770_10276 [Granulicella rosea]|uniref:Uncharacterized protein n=1 Tax=Granulicella rosea TaxID=474952 RepID=A0A239GVC9_9BACT|nr:hypothetical protein [Granulicella rosea]SNS72473.1 hypothetical protein SAMN05421770_10276 [Granulicella rosea]